MVVPHNRRSFLAMLGLAPLFASAASSDTPAAQDEAEATPVVSIKPKLRPGENPDNLPVVRFLDDGTIAHIDDLIALTEPFCLYTRRLRVWVLEANKQVYYGVGYWGEMEFQYINSPQEPSYYISIIQPTTRSQYGRGSRSSLWYIPRWTDEVKHYR